MRKSKLENPLKMDKSLHLINNNAVGKEINKANRKVATKVLEDAKSIEIEKVNNGAKWMRKEKICVLVPTAKVEIYKQNGYL